MVSKSDKNYLFTTEIFCACFALTNFKNLSFSVNSVDEFRSKDIYRLLRESKQEILAYELIKISCFLSTQPNVAEIKDFQAEIKYLKQYLKKFSYCYRSYCKTIKIQKDNLSPKEVNTSAISVLYIITGN